MSGYGASAPGAAWACRSSPIEPNEGTRSFTGCRERNEINCGVERGAAEWLFSAPLLQALVLRYMRLDQLPQAREALKRYVAVFPEDSIWREALARAEEGGA